MTANVQLHTLTSAPARLWRGSDGGGSPAASALESPEGREEVVRACEAALGRTIIGSGGISASRPDMTMLSTLKLQPALLRILRQRSTGLNPQASIASLAHT